MESSLIICLHSAVNKLGITATLIGTASSTEVERCLTSATEPDAGTAGRATSKVGQVQGDKRHVKPSATICT